MSAIKLNTYHQLTKFGVGLSQIIVNPGSIFLGNNRLLLKSFATLPYN
jgi:hypothetical protein